MKTSWDRIEDKWGIGVEGYYLHGRGTRLGWVTSYPRMRSPLGPLWSACSFRDDGDISRLGDYDTKDAAMQAVLVAVGLATAEPPEST